MVLSIVFSLVDALWKIGVPEVIGSVVLLGSWAWNWEKMVFRFSDSEES